MNRPPTQDLESSVPPRGLRALFLGLRRHTSSGLYVPELDGLRFAAILFVFLFHLSGDVVRHNLPGMPEPTHSALYVLAQQLNIGVPLFFAISGMILGLPFARFWLQGGPKVSLKGYFLRRITRLEPPYIVAMLLLFAAKYLAHRGTIAEMLPHLGASLLYLHSIIYREMSSINPVAWSLEVEVQFYILAPLLATIFAIQAAWLRRTVLAIVILFAAAMNPWTDMNVSRGDMAVWMSHLTLLGNIQYFLTGFLLADFYLLLPFSQFRNRRWDLLSVIGWPLLVFLLITFREAAFLTLPGIILLVYVGAFYGTLSSKVFASLWIASIGGMCYTIYLLHNYTIAALGMVTERVWQGQSFELRFAIQILLMTPVVLTMCIVFYKLIEQPCMRSDWPRRLRNFLLQKKRKRMEPSTARRDSR